ncbi:MAG: T9SS type A sorting domain-containing protein [Balneolales bacterium]|nr:T9SS type A sorting domain-containing protein [Balneolales bacterium]
MKNRLSTILASLVVLALIFSIPATADAQFTTIWERNDANGNKPSWFGASAERSMTYHDGKVYVASRGDGANIRILDAQTGADIGTITASGLSGGAVPFNTISVSDDGVVFASNLTVDASDSPFKVYMWENDEATEFETVVTFTAPEDVERLGDHFSVVGSVSEGTAVLFTARGNTPRVHRWVMQSDGEGGFEFVNTPTTTHDIPNMPAWGTPAHATGQAAGGGSTYFASGRSATFVRQYSSAGASLGFIEFAAGNRNVGSLVYEQFDGVEYLFTYHPTVRNARWHVIAGSPGTAFTNRTGADLGSTPVIGATVENTLGDLAVRNNGDGTFTVFVLGTNNGIAAYETDNVLDAGTNQRVISGDAGWRMLASPAQGVKISDLASQNLVQGIPGGTYASAAPNIFTGFSGLNDGPGGNGWQIPADMDTELEPGRGFIWAMFNNEEVPESKSLPITLNFDGTVDNTDVTVSVHSDGSKFNLLGNPFRSSIDVSALTGDGDFSGTVQVWQDGDGNAETGTQGGTWILESNRVAPYQGFIVENDDATEITIPASAISAGGVFHREVVQETIALELVSRNSERNRVTDRAARIVLRADAHDGWDRWDATKIAPLDAVDGLVYFPSERRGEAIAKAQESRNIEFNDMEIPVDVVGYNGATEFRIGWADLSGIPSDWTVTLVDTETGVSTDMLNAAYYDFSLASTMKKSADQELGAPLTIADNSSRFKVSITDGTNTSMEAISDMPSEVKLAQNFPNPFNPTTRISYELPAESQVRLAVYDLLGRQVAVLVNDRMSPGEHSVNFNAASLSSGVYIYRLEASGVVLTQKMTLVK